MMKVNFSQKVLAEEEQAWHQLIDSLDEVEGCLFASDYTYPGRYHPWQIGLNDSVLRIKGWGRYFEIESSSGLYETLLNQIYSHLEGMDFLEDLKAGRSVSNQNLLIIGRVKKPCDDEVMDESQRSRQYSIFTLIRTLLNLFETECTFFGLYGSFGYQLVHQFEGLENKTSRGNHLPDLILYLPNTLMVKANTHEKTQMIKYDFLVNSDGCNERFKAILQSRETHESRCLVKTTKPQVPYGNLVKALKPLFEQGELFEAVPSYERVHKTKRKASRLFRDLRKLNPSPFHYLIHMGDEHLLGASPEMYVRVKEGIVETCPISGTIQRGTDSLSDHHQIMKLLNSKKDENELTMCTDVDRNDKSKVCIPSSIKVLGRRQIELYSHLIHTVDHVKGTLRPEHDGVDAFIAHMWAVTVTGAPKKAAMNWIEANEASPRQWYGGAIGYLTSKGDVNTGLTLRGIQLKDGRASIRVGATILYDSDPEMETQETLTKAAAMEKVIANAVISPIHAGERRKPNEGGSTEQKALEVLVIDHDDSFVHTLAGYFEKCGCRVKTLRQSHVEKYWRTLEAKSKVPDLVVLSPGPGTPEDFKLHDSIQWAVNRKIPIFGVCLGLQGIITYFGGSLGQLEIPMHGKSSLLMSPLSGGPTLPNGQLKQRLANPEKQLFQLDGINQLPKIGRYHSLYAQEIPEVIQCYAVTEDQCPMAIYHKELPIWAVQFHPESIMSAEDNFGGKIIENLIEKIRS